jgi:hypothetical protein
MTLINYRSSSSDTERYTVQISFIKRASKNVC